MIFFVGMLIVLLVNHLHDLPLIHFDLKLTSAYFCRTMTWFLFLMYVSLHLYVCVCVRANNSRFNCRCFFGICSYLIHYIFHCVFFSSRIFVSHRHFSFSLLISYNSIDIKSSIKRVCFIFFGDCLILWKFQWNQWTQDM